MTQREKLRDNYEDALFALLMDEFAEQEGQRLLEENERLKQDPAMSIPEELDKRCIKTIDRAFAKEKRRKAKHAAYKIISRTAVAVLAVVVLFGTAYAAFPEVRIRSLNLLIEFSEKAASLSLTGESESTSKGVKSPPSSEDGMLFGYRLPEIPDGFEIYLENNTSSSERIEYINESGTIIGFYVIDAEGTVVNRDTENAQNVENIKIHGYDGLLIEKDGWINITWADTDQNNFFTVYCYMLNKDEVLKYAEMIEYAKPS